MVDLTKAGCNLRKVQSRGTLGRTQVHRERPPRHGANLCLLHKILQMAQYNFLMSDTDTATCSVASLIPSILFQRAVAEVTYFCTRRCKQWLFKVSLSLWALVSDRMDLSCLFFFFLDVWSWNLEYLIKPSLQNSPHFFCQLDSYWQSVKLLHLAINTTIKITKWIKLWCFVINFPVDDDRITLKCDTKSPPVLRFPRSPKDLLCLVLFIMLSGRQQENTNPDDRWGSVFPTNEPLPRLLHNLCSSVGFLTASSSTETWSYRTHVWGQESNQ